MVKETENMQSNHLEDSTEKKPGGGYGTERIEKVLEGNLVKKYLFEMANSTEYSSRIDIKTCSSDGHRNAEAIISNGQYIIKILPTNKHGKLCKITIDVPITNDNIKKAEEFWSNELYSVSGCPRTAIIKNGKLYKVRIGTTAFGETDSYHDYEELTTYQESLEISESELKDIPNKTRNTYQESLEKTIKIAAASVANLEY